MLTRVYMKWMPLLVISGGTGISAELVVAFAVTDVFVKQAGGRINYKFSGGDWVTGQPKPFFETFARALLAGI